MTPMSSAHRLLNISIVGALVLVAFLVVDWICALSGLPYVPNDRVYPAWSAMMVIFLAIMAVTVVIVIRRQFLNEVESERCSGDD